MIKDIFPVPAFEDNYIWAFSDATGKQACVVDPGDAEPVVAYLRQTGRTLSHVLITHHHADHTGGLQKLTELFSPLVYGPENPAIHGVSHRLAEGAQFELFGCDFEILEVPGHTLDHIAYLVANPGNDEDPALFCGDTLFAAGCGRIFEGNPPMMYESLQKLARLDGATRVFCTHEYTLANLRFAVAVEPGNTALQERVQLESSKRERAIPTLPSTVDRELATNPFLRCNQPSLRRAAETRAGQSLPGNVEVFATLRNWKNSF